MRQPLQDGISNHAIYDSTKSPLTIEPTDSFTAYVAFESESKLEAICLEWAPLLGNGPALRAYWGKDVISQDPWKPDAVRIGDLPTAGTWTRLTVPASTFQIENTRKYHGVAVRAAGEGTVFWDRIGKLPKPPK